MQVGTDPYQVFEDVNYALLIGARPRGPGMERKDLLSENAKIFIEQGKALNTSAASDVMVLVVGNPANTNALIAMHHAPKIPRNRFFSMMRLDQNRSMAMLANKAHVPVTDVTRMCVWGNHSATQVPDFRQCSHQRGNQRLRSFEIATGARMSLYPKFRSAVPQ